MQSSGAKPADKYPFTRRIEELPAALSSIDPQQLAMVTGAEYWVDEGENGSFQIPVFDKTYLLPHPAFEVLEAQTGRAAPLGLQGVILFYFSTADGTPLAGRWISFTELPDGRFYNQAFQGYSGRLLAERFGQDPAGLDGAVTKLGGRLLASAAGPQIPGDRAFLIQALPRLPLLLAFWEGDEDFEATTQVLFDASAAHYLPTDVCAILGGMLARRLIGG